ncbi:MAG: cytochrome c peroxidase [Glaciecola sp.]|jgi:cytochrome c peroxidase
MNKFRYLLLATSAVITSVVFYLFQPVTKPTPLKDFTAPFVFGRFNLPADNPLTNEAVALGRRLFYDVRLSGNNQISCATCHQQSLAFSDGKKASIGASGKPLAFNSMALINLMWGPRHFFWDGRSHSLEDQALNPIQHVDEMDQNIEHLIHELSAIQKYQTLFGAAYGEISAQNIARALAAFQRTLISSNSRYDQYLRGEIGLSEQEEQGRKLFVAHPDAKASLRGGNCIDCHSQFLTGGFNTQFDGFSNNGLDSEENLKLGLQYVTGNAAHKGLFKVPSLRNIEVTAPYMHDGRFATLEQVLDHYNEGIKPSSTLSPLISEANNVVLNDKSPGQQQPSLSLNPVEKKAIIAFLKTLTDKQFIQSDKFSNPFSKDNKNEP